MNSCSFTARWNEALLDENYQKWQRSPRSVSSDWAAFFEGFELGTIQAAKNGAPASLPDIDEQRSLQTKVDGVIHMYRTLGHSIAKLDPLSEPAPQQARATFVLESFGFGASDLEKEVSSHLFRADKKFKLRELILVLERTYCASVGAEFMHIQDACRRNWVSERLELEEQAKEGAAVDSHHYSGILRTLYRAEAFEHFLHANYVGHKRFSLEGAESLLVSLQALLDEC